MNDLLTQQKTVLYVEKTYLPGMLGYERDIYIAERLTTKYNFVSYHRLQREIVDVVRQAGPKFDALITNMPFHGSLRPVSHLNEFMNVRHAYENSLNILQDIKKAVDMPVIVYTGAGDSAAVNGVFLSVADYIVHKSSSAEEDFKEIEFALERLFLKYETLPTTDKWPDIEIEEGFTTTQVQMNINGGMDFLFVGTILCECKDFPGRILFESLEDVPEKKVCNGKNFREFAIPPVVEEGQRLKIFVEGTGEEARRKVQRLYAAFNSRYSFAMDLERFEK